MTNSHCILTLNSNHNSKIFKEKRHTHSITNKLWRQAARVGDIEGEGRSRERSQERVERFCRQWKREWLTSRRKWRGELRVSEISRDWWAGRNRGLNDHQGSIHQIKSNGKRILLINKAMISKKRCTRMYCKKKPPTSITTFLSSNSVITNPKWRKTRREVNSWSKPNLYQKQKKKNHIPLAPGSRKDKTVKLVRGRHKWWCWERGRQWKSGELGFSSSGLCSYSCAGKWRESEGLQRSSDGETVEIVNWKPESRDWGIMRAEEGWSVFIPVCLLGFGLEPGPTGIDPVVWLVPPRRDCLLFLFFLFFLSFSF